LIAIKPTELQLIVQLVIIKAIELWI